MGWLLLGVQVLGMVCMGCVLPMLRQLRILLAVWMRHDMLKTLL